MKLNKKTPILDDKGDQVKDPSGVLLNVENVCVSALYDTKSTPSQGQDAYTRGKLAHTFLGKEDEITLASEEVSLLKLLVGNTWGPAVVYQVWNILDPK